MPPLMCHYNSSKRISRWKWRNWTFEIAKNKNWIAIGRIKFGYFYGIIESILNFNIILSARESFYILLNVEFENRTSRFIQMYSRVVHNVWKFTAGLLQLVTSILLRHEMINSFHLAFDLDNLQLSSPVF